MSRNIYRVCALSAVVALATISAVSSAPRFSATALTVSRSDSVTCTFSIKGSGLLPNQSYVVLIRPIDSNGVQVKKDGNYWETSVSVGTSDATGSLAFKGNLAENRAVLSAWFPDVAQIFFVLNRTPNTNTDGYAIKANRCI